MNANQVFRWRKLYGEAAAAAATPQLVPMVVKPDVPTEATGPARESVIEIDLGGRYCVRVDNTVDARALRRVLDVLDRR